MFLNHAVELEREVGEGAKTALADGRNDVQDYVLGVRHRLVLRPRNGSAQAGQCQSPAPEIYRSEADG